MEIIEQYIELTTFSRIKDWREQVFKLGKQLGYEQSLLAIFPSRDTPILSEFAFMHTNFSADLITSYDKQKMGSVDPVVTHCSNKSTAILVTPGLYTTRKQKNLYEEACKHGVRSGITLPIHGAGGEFGMLTLVSDSKHDHNFERETLQRLPELSYFRDCIIETALHFIKPPKYSSQDIELTSRELECLQWSVTGKSSWDIGQILNCTEAAINFHFKNIRRKFCTSSRRQALVKAIRLGIIIP